MKTTRYLLTCVLVALMTLSDAASAAGAKYPPVVGEMVKSARAAVPTMDMAAFRKVVDNPGDALILDVREESEFVTGHIPGAVHLPRGLLEFKVWSLVGFPDKTDLNKKVYVHCASGGRASLAAKTMKDLGFTDITAVVMSLTDWYDAGYPFGK